jgi:hypothetical protein
MPLSTFSRKTFILISLLLSSYTYAESPDFKPKVHSFDVFDTLLGRLHKDPLSVFRLVEKRYPFPRFTKLRIAAERVSDGTLEDIYRKFMVMNKLSLEETEKLKAFEIETEISNVFPIVSNLSKVHDGDLLVSDTYYNNEELSQILEKIGLHKRIRLFTAVRGKSKGHIWPELKDKYEILSHLGDNPRSDVTSPKKYGIRGVLCTKTQYTSIEQDVCKRGRTDLANLMRVLRLLNPYPEKSMQGEAWERQAQFNVPRLILGSLNLNAFCQKRNISSLLFSARGCCHFIKIFKKLFPNYTSTYFYTSQSMYQNPSPEFVCYVHSLYSPNSVIVEESGSGAICQKFFTKHLLTIPNYTTLVCCSSSLPRLSEKFKYIPKYLNLDCIGHLISFNRTSPVHAPLEYPLEHVQPAHECIEKCLSLLDEYAVIDHAL